MAEDARWMRLTIAGLQLELPAGMLPDGASGPPPTEQLDGGTPESQVPTGFEGPVAVLEGSGMRLLIDGTPFADPLTGHAGKPAFSTWRAQIDGQEREVVSFGEEGSRVLATRLPGATVTVQLDHGGDPAAALRILSSLRPPAGPADGG